MEFFENEINSCDAAQSMPGSELNQAAFRRLKVGPLLAPIIGDALFDNAPALPAGVGAIGFFEQSPFAAIEMD